ncbi:DEAD/DEAH box helicase [Mycoplasma phocoenae]|uniref:ATP-binding protein n=1 Tax=Mycoplasma phocoenae TaxID=754517 RepID=A0A858U5V8_9MOLU|nr:ATP-binding protein [Mycoplasma phocoenae]QJG66827.1 ATP-binding protein [Mycoplasma phocoenae]
MNKQNDYQFLLTNLLDIENNDSTLSCSVDNEKFFDILKIAGEETFNMMCSQPNFNVKFGEYGHKNLITKLKQIETVEEIENLYKEFSFELSQNKLSMLKKDFEKGKKDLCSELESKFQRSITKWKKIAKRAYDVNIESNIWPLHLGFFFIAVETEKKTVFAPLFFKEIHIEIRNSLIYLKSEGDIKVNTKLVTFLRQSGFDLDTSSFDFSDKSINQVYDYFKNSWSETYDIPDTFKDRIPFKREISIRESLSFHKGLILGFFNVSSGYLWNQMKKIIENNEVEDILLSNFDKVSYKRRVEDVIYNQAMRLFKIQKTNYSQDFATISALYQDTVIWGPPGTGKSQTITNLITNILARGYTALVVSQKRAALEVIRNRLKDLSIFAIFLLNDRNWKLEKFYEPLREFIQKVENFESTNNEDSIEVMPTNAKRFISMAQSVKNIVDYSNVIDAYSTLCNATLDEQTLTDLKSLDSFLKYQLLPNLNDYKSIANHLYTVNKGKKPNLLIQSTNTYPKSIKESAMIIAKNQNLLKVDIDNALKYIHTVDVESLEQVDRFFKYQLENKTVEVNNPRTLAKMLIYATTRKMRQFTQEEQREYVQFTQSIRSGKMKPYKFFHKHKSMIKKLFPIIVTTPDTDLSMWEKGEFNYAILDESSQIFLEKGLPILYLAQRKILAGDDQQMQPTKWFSASYAVEEDEDFVNIESLLDYALARGIYKILLDKNYRSRKAALMTFSSKNFYNSKLDVIDDYTADNNELAIDVIQANGTWDNSMNVEEADIAIQTVLDNFDKYEKIILLVFNAKQQDYILNRIYANHPNLEEALGTEKLSLKNIENIQGDEADLVIISVVYDKNTSLVGTYVARRGGQNALNVAISRAKDKMIVIKSLNSDDIKINESSSEDMVLLREWLRFLDLTEEEKKNYLTNKQNNDWTQTITIDVSNALVEEVKEKLEQSLIKDNPELRIETNYVIGTKKLNIAIINNTYNQILLGIMIDDYSYAGDEMQYVYFTDSFKFLESKNYPLLIIKELEWKVKQNELLRFIKESIDNANEIIKLNNITNDLPNEVLKNDDSIEYNDNLLIHTKEVNTVDSTPNYTITNIDKISNTTLVSVPEIQDDIDYEKEVFTTQEIEDKDIFKNAANTTSEINGLPELQNNIDTNEHLLHTRTIELIVDNAEEQWEFDESSQDIIFNTQTKEIPNTIPVTSSTVDETLAYNDDIFDTTQTVEIISNNSSEFIPTDEAIQNDHIEEENIKLFNNMTMELKTPEELKLPIQPIDTPEEETTVNEESGINLFEIK